MGHPNLPIGSLASDDRRDCRHRRVRLPGIQRCVPRWLDGWHCLHGPGHRALRFPGSVGKAARRGSARVRHNRGGASASLESSAVFPAGFMAGIAYMALAIARFVSLEVLERLRAAARHGSGITVMRVIAVVDVAVESVGAVEPGADSDEGSASKPVRAIVPVRGTIIGCVVEVPVRTGRSDPNADTNLCGRQRSAAE